MYQTYLRQKTFKISTKSSDVTYLPPLWRQASLLNDGSCTLIYPVVKDPRVRGTSLGTCKGVASQCRKIDFLLSICFGSISRFKHYHHVPCRHWRQEGGWHTLSIVTLGVAALHRGNHNNTMPYISFKKPYAFGQENCVLFSWYFGTKYIYIYIYIYY